MDIFKIAFRDYGSKIAIFTGLNLVVVFFSSSSFLTWVISTFMISPFLISIMKGDKINIIKCLSKIIHFKSILFAFLLLASAFIPSFILGFVAEKAKYGDWLVYLSIAVSALSYSKISPTLFMLATGKYGVNLKNKDMLFILILLTLSTLLDILTTKLNEIDKIFALVTAPALCFAFILLFVLITLIILKRNKDQ